MDKVKEYLKVIDKVIEQGKYKDEWESLKGYGEAQWLKDSKFGIYSHWGVYTVPAIGDEWYSRKMYDKKSACYRSHVKTYGAPDTFGYKDLIPLFKGEKFDAETWIQLFKNWGAKYYCLVTEHHEGFKMYKSDLNRWNAAEMGPKSDIFGALVDAGKKYGLIIGATNHMAEHYWFMNKGREIPSDVQDEKYRDFYGPAFLCDDYNAINPPKEWCEYWLACCCEEVDRYHPRIFYFDWWIERLAWKPYLKKFAAYYYNRSEEWGEKVVLFYKHDAFMKGTATCNFERGGLSEMSNCVWQTGTATAYNSFSYTPANIYKNPKVLIRTLIDIVSKNGCLMLDVCPKSDGTFCDEEMNLLNEIGNYLSVNGEAIYESEPFWVYGEGNTNEGGKSFQEFKKNTYSKSDFRFTYKTNTIYAFAMNLSKEGEYHIKSIASENGKAVITSIDKIEILGYPNRVEFNLSNNGLKLKVIGSIKTNYPLCFKIYLPK
ncbi:MAG: alpha-L-fucosidase [Eubacteriales bacterium]